MRRDAKRDSSERGIVNVLRKFGISIYRIDQPCDLICGYRGKTYLVEVKSGHKGYAKSLNDNQQKFSDEWRGSQLVTLHSEADAIAWAQQIGRGEKAAADTFTSLGDAASAVVDAFREKFS